MEKIIDIINYIHEHYPYREELTMDRIIKMIYLADWRAILKNKSQITDIQWVFDHDGPFVEEIEDVMEDNDYFELVSSENKIGYYSYIVSPRNNLNYHTLTEADTEVLDHVIMTTSRLTEDGFLKLIYSTVPVLMSNTGSNIDLLSAAKCYAAA